VKKVILISVVFMFSVSVSAQEIYEAVRKGDVEKVKLLLQKDISLLEKRNENGKTPLHFAAEYGYKSIAQLLLDMGADKNGLNVNDTTPLHYAAAQNHFDVVELLVEVGADIDKKNTQRATPMYFAALQGYTGIVEFLLEHGADVDALDREEGTALHVAANSGNSNLVRLLIDKGANKNKKDINHRTAMHFACRSGNREVIKYLLANGLKYDDPDIFGKTPFYYVLEGKQKDVVELFYSRGIKNIDLTCNDGNTYLHAASAGGFVELTEFLIGEGLNVNVKNVYNSTPLMRAVHKGHKEIEKMLIEAGANPETGKPAMKKGEYMGMKKPGLKPEIFAPGIVSTEDFNERDITFTQDKREFYFTRWSTGSDWNILCMKQEKDGWTDPHPTAFSGEYNDAEACLTPDDQQIFFISNMPKSGSGPAENWEIWCVERQGAVWGTPKILGSPFEGCFYPTFTKDWVMYYTAIGNNIYSSKYSNGKFETPEDLGGNVNTPEAEYNSFVAADGSYIIFTSGGWGEGFGEGDLYICFRNKDGSWTKAKNMGPTVNTSAREYCPSVSSDGKYFFFSSRKYEKENIFWMDAAIIDKLKSDLDN